MVRRSPHVVERTGLSARSSCSGLGRRQPCPNIEQKENKVKRHEVEIQSTAKRAGPVGMQHVIRLRHLQERWV